MTLYRMTRREIAWGWIPGISDGRESLPEPEAGPTAVIEGILRPLLSKPPCVVEFSGGRDSSLLLAVTVNLARREGLPEPIALTQRFPDAPATHETTWQERVVRHLGVSAWLRQTLYDEADLIGPAAAASLHTHGLLWPPLAHTRGRVLAVARGGSLVTGEGGDEVFGPGRLAPLWLALHDRPGCSIRRSAYAVAAVMPNGIRRQVLNRTITRRLGASWLTPDASSSLGRAIARDVAREPMNRRRSLARQRRMRSVEIGVDTIDTLARAADVRTVHPFLEVSFLASLARAGGRVGFASRRMAMESLFGDLLPPDVLQRETKARFGSVAFNIHSRAFARQWDGTGVDHDLVDADALRSEWQRPEPHASSYVLLQSCWLASQPFPSGTASAPALSSRPSVPSAPSIPSALLPAPA